MTTFHTDADLSGSSQFSELETEIGTEFTVGVNGTATFRWRYPSNLPSVTPQLKVWQAGTQVGGTLSFTSGGLSTWVVTPAGSPVTLPAGTYVVSVNTTHYVALPGFYSGGPITRGDITGVRALFSTTPGVAPATPSTATYYVDIDFTADSDPEPEPDPDVPVVDEPRVGSALHLARVMQEIALACSAITGLSRFYSYPPASTTAPAGYVSYPSRILYNQTYQRGQADYEDLPIVLIVGRPYERRARDLVADWSAADGPRSVVARLEEWDWQSCDDVTVGSGEFDVETIAGIEYLAIMFKASVVGPGRD
jgi:hypothetical protein